MKAFSPLDGCVVLAEKQQKKATWIKPRKITVVLITDPDCKKIPREAKRQSLNKDGFIKQLEFSKNMSSKQVRNIITRGFLEKIVGEVSISFLLADPRIHVLIKHKEQAGGANGADVIELVGQASFYVKILCIYIL